jgi:hypothetical protein
VYARHDYAKQNGPKANLPGPEQDVESSSLILVAEVVIPNLKSALLLTAFPVEHTCAVPTKANIESTVVVAVKHVV